MSTLTVAIEDALLTRARIMAADRGTTVDQMVREFLESEVRVARASDCCPVDILSANLAGLATRCTSVKSRLFVNTNVEVYTLSVG